MARLGAIETEKLTPRQREVVQKIASGPRASLGGPFWPWMRSPELADRAQSLGEFVRFKSSLPPRIFELAVLFTGRTWTAQFEWHIHADLALKAGLAPPIVDAIAANKRPNFDKDDEAAVYEFCAELYATKRVSDARYRAVVRHFGETGVVELVGVLGYYALVSMTLNVFEVPVPPGVQPPLQEV